MHATSGRAGEDGSGSLVSPGTFRLRQLVPLPEPARRFLSHAVSEGATLATRVRLKMRGEIKLKGWLPFTAVELLDTSGAMTWNATVRMLGLPIFGYDRVRNGEGEMKWKMLGIFPVMRASGPDITKSAIGRVLAESMWLPSVLCAQEIEWASSDASHATAKIRRFGVEALVNFEIDSDGRLLSTNLLRWGNPDSGIFRFESFGGFAEEERTFGEFTIPTKFRAGWYFGTDRFESEGEFFRCEIEDASFEVKQSRVRNSWQMAP